MNNCNFTKYEDDGVMLDIFYGMNNNKLKRMLDDYFNKIENYITYHDANTREELFYLIEEINNMKIIINILVGESKNE